MRTEARRIRRSRREHPCSGVVFLVEDEVHPDGPRDGDRIYVGLV